MTASTTEQERAEFEKAWRERPIYMGGVHQKEVAYIWWTQAARRAPAVPVPSRRPTLEEIEEAVGYHSSGWDCVDPSELIDAIMNIATAPKPPEADHIPDAGKMVAAPVQLPEPVAFALEWTFNGEERGMRLYDDETHCRFDAESDGGVCHPLYTEQQVRDLLAAHGIGKDKA